MTSHKYFTYILEGLPNKQFINILVFIINNSVPISLFYFVTVSSKLIFLSSKKIIVKYFYILTLDVNLYQIKMRLIY